MTDYNVSKVKKDKIEEYKKSALESTNDILLTGREEKDFKEWQDDALDWSFDSVFKK